VNNSSDALYLKPETKMELLMFRWFAWPHLISPTQHALNMTFRHLPLMTSFISNPKIHISAMQDPMMLGGPFVDLPEHAVPLVKELLERTRDEGANLIHFAQELRAFDKAVQERAKGFSLDEFYGQISQSIAGAIEISYDINNHPNVRVIEEIVYDHYLNNKHAQEVLLHNIKDTERTFFMSTPRLALDKAFTCRMEFADPRIDLLSSMRTHPHSLNEVANLLDVDMKTTPLFADFFTDVAPRRKECDYQGDGVRVRYFGHACIVIQTAKTCIVIDPVVTWDNDEGDCRFSFFDLPDRIDYLIISHCHQDHFSPESLVQLRRRVRKVVVPRNLGGNVTDPSMKLILQRLGYSNIEVVDIFGRIEFDEGEIISLPFSGEHADLNIQSKHTFVVSIKGRKLFFLVDSDAINPALYRLLGEIVGQIDVAFVGMECVGAPLTWLYGPLLTGSISRRNDESRRLSGADCERAWRLIVEELKCRSVYIYAMGQEPWMRYLMGLEYQPDSVQLQQAGNFVSRCTQAGVTVEYLRIAKEMII
jgi:L-ascorbate metabolism protein UlaG (beta-lactamase superfamily)